MIFQSIRCLTDTGQSNWPSWIQAGGAILGIAIAISIPAWQRRRDTKDRQKREMDEARSLTLALLAPMAGFAENVRFRYECVTRERQGLAGPIDGLKLPDMLYERLHELHKLGAAAEAMQATVYWFSRIDSKRIVINSSEHLGKPINDRGKIYIRAGTEDLRRLDEACTRLKKIFDQLLNDFFVEGVRSTETHQQSEKRFWTVATKK